MQKQDIQIINKLGLHARASSKFVQTASPFQTAAMQALTALINDYFGEGE